MPLIGGGACRRDRSAVRRAGSVPSAGGARPGGGDARDAAQARVPGPVAATRGARRRRPAARGAEARSANRPAAARRDAAGGSRRKRTCAPRPRRFTGRATVLVAVLIALALAYTYPVRVYLDQQADIAPDARRRRRPSEQRSELTDEAAKWQDDEYIETQARERFFMVAPGREAAGGARDPAARPGRGRHRRPTDAPDPGTTPSGPACGPPTTGQPAPASPTRHRRWTVT